MLTNIIICTIVGFFVAKIRGLKSWGLVGNAALGALATGVVGILWDPYHILNRILLYIIVGLFISLTAWFITLGSKRKPATKVEISD